MLVPLGYDWLSLMLYNAAFELIKDGPLTVQVNGNCMGNLLRNGCRVQLARQRFYLPGDIIVFGRGDQRMVSHRLLGFSPGRHGWIAITQADREARPDAPFSVDRILGKVTAIDGVPVRYPLYRRAWAAVRFIKAFGYLLYRKLRRG